MSKIAPPSPARLDDHGLQSWHIVNKVPWDVLVGIGYVDGASLSLHAGSVDALTAAQGEVCLDPSDSTRDEKELDSAAEDIYVVSTSASDTTAIKIVGVNSDQDCDEKTVTLNGTTPVQVLSSAADDKWCNINRVFNVAVVPYVGVVYCSTKSIAGEPANTDNIQCKMPVGAEYASNPMIMCGNNEVLVFTGVDITASRRDEIAIHIARRLTITTPWIKVFKVFAFEGFLPYRFIVPIVLTEGSKIVFTGESTTNNTDVTWQSSYYSLARDTAVAPTQGVGILFKQD